MDSPFGKCTMNMTTDDDSDGLFMDTQEIQKDMKEVYKIVETAGKQDQLTDDMKALEKKVNADMLSQLQEEYSEPVKIPKKSFMESLKNLPAKRTAAKTFTFDLAIGVNVVGGQCQQEEKVGEYPCQKCRFKFATYEMKRYHQYSCKTSFVYKYYPDDYGKL